MTGPELAVKPAPPASESDSRLQKLHDTILHAAHLQPSQGPITVIGHRNTLPNEYVVRPSVLVFRWCFPQPLTGHCKVSKN